MPQASVRAPVCADDHWYPRAPSHLRHLLADLLAHVPEQPLDGELIGLIAPHAGYTYSGLTAAHAYKQLPSRTYERAVVIGPSHFENFGAQALNQKDFYETPLGEIEIDAAAVNELNRRVGINFLPNDREHSLEMQLPFLQHTLGEFKLLPLMMSYSFYLRGIQARNPCENLSAALAPMMDDKTLLIASSDLSHLHDYDAVTYFDQGFENLITDYNLGGLIDYMINEGECRACGDMAIITVLMTAKARGANRVKVLHRTNSGDVRGVRTSGEYTVGYMAAAIYRAEN